MQALLTAQGYAFDLPIKITKGITLESEGNTLEITYLLEGLPTDRPLHFAVELNFAGLAYPSATSYQNECLAVAQEKTEPLAGCPYITSVQGLDYQLQFH